VRDFSTGEAEPLQGLDSGRDFIALV
jgi:hypothetical protein